ncbi:MAG: hypothetical protein FJ284_06695, partial [Planctomycetes bacterium]|nr:hypothetical protein [Planctomycetota bacterium]
MSVRIYTLAKEMKLDSKDLVELCTRAGIQDKGSALASLTDEEVVKLREFLAGKTKPAERSAAAAAKPGVPVRPTTTAPVKREDYIAPAGVVGKGKPPEIAPPKPPAAGGPPAKPRPGSRSADGAKPMPRPAFKLAPLPAAGRAPPPATRSSQEPVAQKPDVKLPLDAIRSAKQVGAKPLADHMRKAEQRQAGESGRPQTAGPLRGAGGPGAAPL